MDLKRKLARLENAGPGSGAVHDAVVERARPVEHEPAGDADAEENVDSGRRGRIERLRRTLEEMVAQKGHPNRERMRSSESSTLPGTTRETPIGPVHVVERWYADGHVHGRTEPHGALAVDPRTVAKLALDGSFETVDFRRALFLDTETTGLAGGTGTIPFVVGMAYFDDRTLRVEQLFLRRPGEEAPLLGVLAERLASASCIVTYNGKSFDWPLLRTRFVLNRVRLPGPPIHLDLLPCARRIFRRRLASVRLVDLEAELLGLERVHDISGAEIPAVYLRYLRSQEPTGIASILEHNGNDLVSLAALLSALAMRYDALAEDDDPRDHLSYAEVAARAGDLDRAVHFARAASLGRGDAACTVHACLVEATIARRRGDLATEEARLHRALEVADDEAIVSSLHLRLAKLHEHRSKDWLRAIAHAAHTAVAEGEIANAHRIARLRRRVDRSAR